MSKNTSMLILLSGIWGSSFIFMRVISPVLGPVITASARLLIGGLFLLIVYKVGGVKLDWKSNWRQLLLIGIISQAIPYFMFAFAALHITSNISVIMNSTSPIFGVILSTIVLNDKVTVQKVVGVLLGTTGVIIISLLNNNGSSSNLLIGICACIVAAFMYGVSSVYIKAKASHLDPKLIATGSQIFAGLSLLPFTVNSTIGPISIYTIILLLIFGIVCSGVASLIYYRLIVEMGPVKTLTVTYLMPFFGIIFSIIFLNERITVPIIIGGSIILLGTIFITQNKLELKKA